MLAIAGGILIAAAVLFAIYVSWVWLTGNEGGAPERYDWAKVARRPDPRFDEWSDFYREHADTSSHFEKRKRKGGESYSLDVLPLRYYRRLEWEPFPTGFVGTTRE